jgi:hypothetical protein
MGGKAVITISEQGVKVAARDWNRTVPVIADRLT